MTLDTKASSGGSPGRSGGEAALWAELMTPEQGTAQEDVRLIVKREGLDAMTFAWPHADALMTGAVNAATVRRA